MNSPYPARSALGSLSEGAVSPNGLTEGVSSDGCSGPTVYAQAFIGSEIFEPITFIEVHSLSFAALSSSLREGAGRGCTIHRAAR